MGAEGYFAQVQSVVKYGILAWSIALRRSRRDPTLDLFEGFAVLRPHQLFVKYLFILIKINKGSFFCSIAHQYETGHRVQFGFEFPRPVAGFSLPSLITEHSI